MNFDQNIPKIVEGISDTLNLLVCARIVQICADYVQNDSQWHGLQSNMEFFFNSMLWNFFFEINFYQDQFF